MTDQIAPASCPTEHNVAPIPIAKKSGARGPPWHAKRSTALSQCSMAAPGNRPRLGVRRPGGDGWGAPCGCSGDDGSWWAWPTTSWQWPRTDAVNGRGRHGGDQGSCAGGNQDQAAKEGGRFGGFENNIEKSACGIRRRHAQIECVSGGDLRDGGRSGGGQPGRAGSLPRCGGLALASPARSVAIVRVSCTSASSLDAFFGRPPPLPQTRRRPPAPWSIRLFAWSRHARRPRL